MGFTVEVVSLLVPTQLFPTGLPLNCLPPVGPTSLQNSIPSVSLNDSATFFSLTFCPIWELLFSYTSLAVLMAYTSTLAHIQFLQTLNYNLCWRRGLTIQSTWCSPFYLHPTPTLSLCVHVCVPLQFQYQGNTDLVEWIWWHFLFFHSVGKLQKYWSYTPSLDVS